MRQLKNLKTFSGPQVTLQLRSLRHPITVRPGTDDIPALMNNAIREEYGQFSKQFKPCVIIDAGAYIGDTSAYFLTRFPEAHVIALEPNRDSYEQAVLNLSHYEKKVTLLKLALWNEVTHVKFKKGQTGAAIASEGEEIPTITISSLMTKFNLPFIDLLKIDIEGAESQVIPQGIGSWLDKVGIILLETHGNNIEKKLIPLLCNAEFKCTRHRNVWYCKKNNK